MNKIEQIKNIIEEELNNFNFNFDEVTILEAYILSEGDISRKNMPQVDSDNLPQAIKLASDKVKVSSEKIAVGKLKKSQKELHKNKIIGISKSFKNAKDLKPLVISSDNFIVDGHHRWAAAIYKWGDDVLIPVIRIGLPKIKAITLFNNIAVKLKQPKKESIVIESISTSDKLKIYNNLKKGDFVDIKFDSSIRKGDDYKTFIVSKGKTTVGKRKVERISLKLKSGIAGGNRCFLYHRKTNNGKDMIELAIGDMAASIVDMKASANESLNEDDPCWDDYKVGSPKTKTSSSSGKRVNNCVPKNESKKKSIVENNRRIKVLDGHLTAHDKKVINQMMDNNMDSGKVGKKTFIIKDLGDGKYHITQKIKDRGMIPVPGSAFRISTHISNIIVKEAITVPIEIGDTVLGGKFKNKKIVVKTIDTNEKGDITINGKPFMKFRILKESSGESIQCQSCDHNWELEFDDDRPYLCHSCGYDQSMQKIDIVAFEDWKSQNKQISELNEVQSKLKLSIPKNVLDIHKAFKKEGRKLYIVGGAVRDAILKQTPKDFDLATDAKPDDVLDIAKKYGFKTAEVGKQFGVVIVNGEEIATFRKDIGKGRRPDAVDYTDIYGDVKRRDLTINALFYDIDRKQIVDLVGGIADLKNKSIKTVGDAKDRFDEDPLRKLRALRFTARIGGRMEKDTVNAIKDNPDISGVSAERIRDEFIKSIKTAKSSKSYLKMVDSFKMLKQILPNVRYNTDFIENGNYKLVIANLLRKNTDDLVYKVLKKLKYTDKESLDIAFLIKLVGLKSDDVYKMKRAQVKTTLEIGEIIEWGNIIGSDLKKFANFKLSYGGNDVKSLGLKGKDIGDKIEQMEIEKYINESLKSAGIKNFKDLFKKMPSDLQKRVYNLKNSDQRRDFHPEGNVLKHTIVVVNRAIKDDDIDIALAAMFHDIGKDETASSSLKTRGTQHLGHEAVSASLVKKHKKFIEDVGGNAANVFYIVKNHMRIKKMPDMRKKKQDKLKSFRAFDKLNKFTKHDRGGFDESNINEMPKADLEKIDKFADTQLKPIDVDLTGAHFFARLNDPRNKKEISVAELVRFFKQLGRNKKEFLSLLDKYKSLVATDDKTNINIPFMKKSNRAIAKTVMRKRDFKSSDKKITI